MMDSPDCGCLLFDAKVRLKDGEIEQLTKLAADHSRSAEILVLTAYVLRILPSFSLAPSDLRPDLPLFLGK